MVNGVPAKYDPILGRLRERDGRGKLNSSTFYHSRMVLVLSWTSIPVLYDSQSDYNVYEYTYGTTKYYRKVPTTYTAAEDKFFEDAAMTTLITSRDLSF